MLALCFCCRNLHFSYMRVLVGQNSLDKKEENELAFDIADVSIHPDWE